MKFTENMLSNYAAPLSESEDNRCKNAISMVSDALKGLGLYQDQRGIHKLYEDTYSYAVNMANSTGTRKVKIFVQGSYANNTNVRTESDVDIAVIQEEVFRTKYRTTGMYIQTDADYGFRESDKKDKSFKDEVLSCLREKFGRDVERKNKSIKIHGNSYRNDADAVPCMRYRDYTNDYKKDEGNYVGGIVIIADSGESIINYPEQHIENGRKKNQQTNHSYKKMVRIMKKMRYLMEDCGYDSAKNVSSFLLESLLYNIPNEFYLEYGQYRKVFIFDNIINYVVSHKSSYDEYTEANGIKPLCGNSVQKSKLEAFVTDLRSFYEYE